MRGVRRRARRQPRDHHRPDGQPAQPRRGRADGQAVRQHHHPRSTWSRRSAPTRPGTPWSATRWRPTSTSTSTSGPRPPATTRCSTSSTPTPASPRSCGTPPSWASSRARTPRCSATRRRASCSGRSRSSRGSSTPPPRCASRTGSRATSRTPPPPTTASTTAAGCSRWATRTRPTCTAPGCGSSRPPGPSWPTAWPARGLRPRAHVSARMPTHEAGWAHADGALRARLAA